MPIRALESSGPRCQPAAEALQVGPARMRPDGHTMYLCQTNGGSHDQRVTGMQSTRYVGGGNERHDGCLISEPVLAKAFAHITVEIDFHSLRFLQESSGLQITRWE